MDEHLAVGPWRFPDHRVRRRCVSGASRQDIFPWRCYLGRNRAGHFRVGAAHREDNLRRAGEVYLPAYTSKCEPQSRRRAMEQKEGNC